MCVYLIIHSFLTAHLAFNITHKIYHNSYKTGSILWCNFKKSWPILCFVTFIKMFKFAPKEKYTSYISTRENREGKDKTQAAFFFSFFVRVHSFVTVYGTVSKESRKSFIQPKCACPCGALRGAEVWGAWQPRERRRRRRAPFCLLGHATPAPPDGAQWRDTFSTEVLILEEIHKKNYCKFHRQCFIVSVSLDYCTIDQATGSLSFTPFY